MSVIVKGMKMPKSCIECVINHSFFRVLKCSELKGMKGFKKLPHEHDRHPDCPLVALPKKHGRLIDGDYLYNRLKALGLKDENVFRIIKEEPTAVESEE